ARATRHRRVHDSCQERRVTASPCCDAAIPELYGRLVAPRAPRECRTVEKSDLLNQLRIDRDEERSTSRGSRAWIGVVVALVVLALLAAGGWWWFAGGKSFEVEAATAIAPASNAAGPLAVLQATGYVTARREAT